MFRRIQRRKPCNTDGGSCHEKSINPLRFVQLVQKKGIINKIVPTTINRKSLRQLFEQVKYTTFF